MRRVMTILLLLCVPAISACGTTTSTSSFHGTEHAVAQTIANLQSDVTSAEQKKICTNDVSASVVRKLGGQKGCEAAVKSQVAEIDNTEVTVEAVHVAGTSATAKVRSVYRGKKRSSTVALVQEGGKWKVSALQ
jgi:hypothetical protein